MRFWWGVSWQDNQQYHDRQATNGSVDPEAPSPIDLRREETTEQRPGNGCKTKRRAKETHVFRSLLQGEQVDEDDHCAGEGAGTADTGDSASDYKGMGRRGGGADD